MSTNEWPEDAVEENWALEIEVGRLNEERSLLRVQKLLWYGAAEELAMLYYAQHGELPECLLTARELDPDA